MCTKTKPRARWLHRHYCNIVVSKKSRVSVYKLNTKRHASLYIREIMHQPPRKVLIPLWGYKAFSLIGLTIWFLIDERWNTPGLQRKMCECVCERERERERERGVLKEDGNENLWEVSQMGVKVFRCLCFWDVLFSPTLQRARGGPGVFWSPSLEY